MKLRSVIGLGFLLSLFPAATSSAGECGGCLSAGSCCTVSASPPPGFAIAGTPQAFEDDWTSPDDPMGPASPNGSGGYSVEVCNNGGALSGPNGQVQNGDVEGDDIEVEICFEIWRVTTTTTTSTGGSATTCGFPPFVGYSEQHSGSETETGSTPETVTKCVGKTTVSPCS